MRERERESSKIKKKIKFYNLNNDQKDDFFRAALNNDSLQLTAAL